VRTVAIASIDSTRVEVPFETIAPSRQEQWSQDSTFDIKIPIGRAGAKRLQYLQLGKGVNQHMLIAGKTGSGNRRCFISSLPTSPNGIRPTKSSFTWSISSRGSSSKHTPLTDSLTHAPVAIESDREFGLSILQRLDLEMNIRGEKFRQARVQDISAYRQTTGEKMPRTILIVDEFHILFAEDDKICA